jgi:hypothetical protein
MSLHRYVCNVPMQMLMLDLPITSLAAPTEGNRDGAI